MIVGKLALVGIFGLLSSCCSTVPPPGKYFDITWDARDCMRKFQYAVETGFYDAAYDCLTEESQEQFTRTRFKLFLKLGGELGPQFQDIQAWEIIVNSEFVELIEDYPNKVAQVKLWFDDPARDISVSQTFVFRGVSKPRSENSTLSSAKVIHWQLDLSQTIDNIVGAATQ